MDDAALWTDYLSYLQRAPDASGVTLFHGYRHELSPVCQADVRHLR
jgi:hypothetical protein